MTISHLHLDAAGNGHRLVRKDVNAFPHFSLFFLLMQTKGHYIHTDKRGAYTNKIQFYAYTEMIYIERNTTYKLITLFFCKINNNNNKNKKTI